jgi:hypothetical protein
MRSREGGIVKGEEEGKDRRRKKRRGRGKV